MSGSKPIYKDLKTPPAKLPPVMKSPGSSIIADKNLIDLALDTLQDVFYVFDLEGRFLHWNLLSAHLDVLFSEFPSCDKSLAIVFCRQAEQV